MQLEENSNQVKLSLWIYFGEEYSYTLYNDNLTRFEFSSNCIVYALYVSFII